MMEGVFYALWPKLLHQHDTFDQERHMILLNPSFLLQSVARQVRSGMKMFDNSAPAWQRTVMKLLIALRLYPTFQRDPKLSVGVKQSRRADIAP